MNTVCLCISSIFYFADADGSYDISEHFCSVDTFLWRYRTYFILFCSGYAIRAKFAQPRIENMIYAFPTQSPVLAATEQLFGDRILIFSKNEYAMKKTAW